MFAFDILLTLSNATFETRTCYSLQYSLARNYSCFFLSSYFITAAYVFDKYHKNVSACDERIYVLKTYLHVMNEFMLYSNNNYEKTFNYQQQEGLCCSQKFQKYINVFCIINKHESRKNYLYKKSSFVTEKKIFAINFQSVLQLKHINAHVVHMNC